MECKENEYEKIINIHLDSDAAGISGGVWQQE